MLSTSMPKRSLPIHPMSPLIPATAKQHPLLTHDMYTSAAHDDPSTWGLRRSRFIGPTSFVPNKGRAEAQRHQGDLQQRIYSLRGDVVSKAPPRILWASGMTWTSLFVWELYIYIAISTEADREIGDSAGRLQAEPWKLAVTSRRSGTLARSEHHSRIAGTPDRPSS